uniref:Cnidarian restricted protein n=1 Tax=Clytia hemisphaerica TaxID=252671 RepID=A0A7M6DQU0_9CNID
MALLKHIITVAMILVTLFLYPVKCGPCDYSIRWFGCRTAPPPTTRSTTTKSPSEKVAILAYTLYEKLMWKMRSKGLGKLKSKPSTLIKRGRRSTLNELQIETNENIMRTLRKRFLRGIKKNSLFRGHPLKRKSLWNGLENQIK